MKLTIGTIHGYELDAFYVHSLLGVVNSRPDYLNATTLIRSGPALAMARGYLVREFLSSDSDTLLMLDSDQAFPPSRVTEHVETWEKANAQEDIIEAGGCHLLSGLVFCSPKEPHHDPAALKASLFGLQPDDSGHHFQISDYPVDSFCEVAATGAAALMVSREVCQAIKDHYGETWFHHVVLGDGDQLGEDISFCVRARHLGYHVYAHTSLFYDHAKVMLLGPRVIPSASAIDAEPQEG